MVDLKPQLLHSNLTQHRYTMGARTGVRIAPMIVNQNPGPGHYFASTRRAADQNRAPFGRSAPRLPPIGLNNVPGHRGKLLSSTSKLRRVFASPMITDQVSIEIFMFAYPFGMQALELIVLRKRKYPAWNYLKHSVVGANILSRRTKFPVSNLLTET